MIINDTYNFVFIHIPKCAGTTVRFQLQPFDQTGGSFTGRVDEHPELGIIDYVHIPLFILRQYFPVEYEKIRTYSSFAVVRDPFGRFPSSLSQHLKKCGDGPIHNMKTEDIRRAVDKAIKFLLSYGEPYLPYQYIHFQEQVDFIYDGRERLVSNVYPISAIPEMLVDIGNKLNTRLEGEAGNGDSRANQTTVYRNTFVRAVAETTKPILKSFLGPESRKSLREKAAGFFFIPRDKKLKDIFDSSYVQDFIREYYASDLDFVNKLNSAKAEKADTDFLIEKDSV